MNFSWQLLWSAVFVYLVLLIIGLNAAKEPGKRLSLGRAVGVCLLVLIGGLPVWAAINFGVGM